jgi:signal transduction histidine kinase
MELQHSLEELGCSARDTSVREAPRLLTSTWEETLAQQADQLASAVALIEKIEATLRQRLGEARDRMARQPVAIDQAKTRGDDPTLLEGERRQSQKLEAVGQLAAGIAHELNTPIQYIGANIQFLLAIWGPVGAVLELCDPVSAALKASSADPALVRSFETALDAADLDYVRQQIPKALDESVEGIKRLSTTVQAVKEFCHPGGREMSAVDLNHAIESTIVLAQNHWKYVAKLVTDFDRDLPRVLCLGDQIRQVVLNLLANASHAIEEKNHGALEQLGTITVGTRRVCESVEISIQDTGAGMSEAVRSRVFDPFFTTKPVGKGTGQGLSLAHSTIVRRHGGKIWLESQPGVGTTVFVTLPIAGTEGSA